MDELKNTTTFEPDYYVYTDGACTKNGSKDAVAGIGIFFGENDPRNVSQKITDLNIISENEKQTNNIAELGAIYYLYKLIENDLTHGKKIGIVTDSQYAIWCVSSYGKKCEENNWKKDIPNKELVKTTYNLYKNNKNIKFYHIKSHTQKTDIHSIGNDWADKLANNAIGVSECPYTKLYINVPFAKKDEVKKMGGKWDATKKKWYIFHNNNFKDIILLQYPLC